MIKKEVDPKENRVPRMSNKEEEYFKSD